MMVTRGDIHLTRGSLESKSLTCFDVFPFKGITLTRNYLTILTQEDFGWTYHKDHFINQKFLFIYFSFQDIGLKVQKTFFAFQQFLL